MGKKPTANRLLLVVDDVTDGREMLSEYLRFHGFDVVEAVNGADAVDAAQKNPPRIVLMDLTMPGVDGWEATRRLKADARTRDVIVIAVTANALDGDEAKARAAGCDGYIAKPFDLYTLAQRLREVVAHGASALAKPSGVATEASRPASRRSS
jgi:CheY-like chemotaxis protein